MKGITQYNQMRFMPGKEWLIQHTKVNECNISY